VEIVRSGLDVVHVERFTHSVMKPRIVGRVNMSFAISLLAATCGSMPRRVALEACALGAVPLTLLLKL
jgi:hypothetical protein